MINKNSKIAKKIIQAKLERQNFKFYSLCFNFSQGFGLIEVIVVTAIVVTTFFAFAQSGILALRLLREEKENLEATLLAQEGLEAVRVMRDESWTNNINPLVNGTTYYPVIENGKWKLTTTDPGLINNKYSRTIISAQVFRDVQDKIAGAGTVDANTRKVTSRISWGNANATSVEFTDGTTDGDLGNFPSNNSGNGDPAQSFTTPAGSSIVVSQVELFLKKVSSPSDVFLEIRSGSTVGPILAISQTITSSTIPSGALSWTIFTFPTPPTLSPSTQYFLRMRSIPSSNDAFSGSAGTLNWGYKQTGSSPYSGGDAWRYVGRLSNPSDPGQILTQYDFAFRVYKNVAAGESKEVIMYLTNFQEPINLSSETVSVSYTGATTDSNLVNFPSNNLGDGDPVQGFTTPGTAIEVTKAELYLKRATTNPSPVYVEIRDTPTGNILGTSNMLSSASIVGSALAWVEFRFSTPVKLNAATTYYIRLRSSPVSTQAGSGSLGTLNWGYLQSGGSPYSGGVARRYVGKTSPSDQGELLSDYDFGFKIYDLQ